MLNNTWIPKIKQETMNANRLVQRTSQRSRSPHRVDHRPESESQTMMTYDHKQEKFMMFEEDIHKKAIHAAMEFDKTDISEGEQEQDIRECIWEDTDFPMNEYAIEWKYEHTGMTYKDSSDYYLWWAKHKHYKQRFTNIKTREHADLWIYHKTFWDMGLIEKDLDNIIRALRVEYEQ